MVGVLTSWPDMARQTRPSGPSWPVDDAWKRGVLAEMAEAGISRSEMARRVGCKPSALTVLFGPETIQSRLVPAIHRELSRPAPSIVTASDEVLRRINRKWPSLSKEQRTLIDQMIDQLVATTPPRR